MKILLAGDWRFDIYEKALADGLVASGQNVVPFRWGDFFDYATGWRAVGAEIQRRVRAGPLIAALNGALVDAAVAAEPDCVFVFRGDVVFAKTFHELRRCLPNTVLAVYNNDDAFSPIQPRHRFRHFVRSLAAVDIAFAYRPANLNDFQRAGASETALLPPWYVAGTDQPPELTDADMERFGCDVVFVGHYEDDGRMEMLEDVAAAGFRLRLFGTGWPSFREDSVLAPLFPVLPLRGIDYRKALASAKIALAFLSNANRDCYTRRNFEIPAIGGFMLSAYTPELAEMFTPGQHAAYFRDRAELVAKIGHYLQHDEERTRIAEAGRRHSSEAGYDSISRANNVAVVLQRLIYGGSRVLNTNKRMPT